MNLQKTEKLLSAIGYSVIQEINKTGTLPRGITEVAISKNSTKLELHHIASLGLLILQKLEIQQNWNFTTWHLWIC